MSNRKHLICPDCVGVGTLPTEERAQCPRCKGEGYVSPEMRSWITLGYALRTARTDAGISAADLSVYLRIPLNDYLAQERGMAAPEITVLDIHAVARIQRRQTAVKETA